VASPAALKYTTASNTARTLRETATDPRLQPISRSKTQVYCHSALAAFVAVWDAYINELVRNFFAATANPLDPKFHAVHSIARNAAERALERFNTPNWENTRTLLIQNTGYDPIGDWVWPARSMSGLAVQQKLNEILKVRHSFAHGFAIPALSWTQTATGRVWLTANAIDDVDVFFTHLVNVTDLGMKQHIETSYSLVLPW